MNTLADWFDTLRTSPLYEQFQKHPVVYFCAEFAITERLRTYAGGLGVLAGDYLREAIDQSFPLVGVSLFYPEGYIGREIAGERVREEKFFTIPAEDTELKPVLDSTNKPIIVEIPFSDYIVYAKAWSWKSGSVEVFFLDTNVEQNRVADRTIINRLYEAGKESRFKHEMILGIGGFRLLEKLQISPSLYHMNEGHSALLSIEVTRKLMKDLQIPFAQAIRHAREKIVFTNHTLVPAGHDSFNREFVATMLNKLSQELQVPTTEILSLGLIADSEMFSMTTLALTMAGKINAVSKSHSKRAQQIWPNVTMEPITNGIHIQTWDKTNIDNDLIHTHLNNKKALLNHIELYTKKKWDEKTLLLGWARRIVPYKRPLMILDDIEHIERLATHSERPIHIVFSGQAHPDDAEGKEILELMRKKIAENLADHAVYLPDYNMVLAKLMTAGCDIWLNTPIVGFEACGTSGMKAALNGSLACSTADGWVEEVDLSDKGWIITRDNSSTHLMYLVEEHIIPEYYNTDKSIWSEKMKKSSELIKTDFSTTRMLKEYIEKLYSPLLNQG